MSCEPNALGHTADEATPPLTRLCCFSTEHALTLASLPIPPDRTQVLPSLAARLGPAALLKAVGVLGLAWLAMWRLTLARLAAAGSGGGMPLHSQGLQQGHGHDDGGGRKGRPVATPWRAMLTHPAVWAIVVNNYTFHYAFYVVMNWLPTYFDKVGGGWGGARGWGGVPWRVSGALVAHPHPALPSIGGAPPPHTHTRPPPPQSSLPTTPSHLPHHPQHSPTPPPTCPPPTALPHTNPATMQGWDLRACTCAACAPVPLLCCGPTSPVLWPCLTMCGPRVSRV